VVPAWTVEPGPPAALRAVTNDGFRPEVRVILEQPPRFPELKTPALGGADIARAGTATYAAEGTQRARIEVWSSRPAILLIRNGYDPNWHARVDGAPAAVVPADYISQGVPIPAGRHRVVLTYDDPWIGYGMAGSALVLLIAAWVAFLLRGAPVGPRRAGYA